MTEEKQFILINFPYAHIIGFWERVMEHIHEVKIVDQDTFITTCDGHITLYNHTQIIKQFDISNIQQILITNNIIIVRNTHQIFIFDRNLNLKVQSVSHIDIRLMDLLPDNQLITISDGSLIIWNIKDLSITFETTKIKGRTNVLLNGRVFTIRNGRLAVYK